MIMGYHLFVWQLKNNYTSPNTVFLFSIFAFLFISIWVGRIGNKAPLRAAKAGAGAWQKPADAMLKRSL